MLTKLQAQELVLEEIMQLSLRSRIDLCLLHDKTIEKDFGWVFFYYPRKYLETKDIKYAVGGNAPFFINRDTGEIKQYPTFKSIDECIREFEQSWILQKFSS